jgi:hypothetical protein
MNTKTALKFAKDISASDIRAFARAVMEAYETSRNDNDFTVETEEGEYRFIEEDAIERIHREEIEELVDDCYLSEASDICKRYFDYDSFVRDCRLSDGYGHHFSSYDGSEENEGTYYMFRVG